MTKWRHPFRNTPDFFSSNSNFEAMGWILGIWNKNGPIRPDSKYIRFFLLQFQFWSNGLNFRQLEWRLIESSDSRNACKAYRISFKVNFHLLLLLQKLKCTQNISLVQQPLLKDQKTQTQYGQEKLKKNCCAWFRSSC